MLSGDRENVKLTMCAGKILYENGEYHIGVSPAEILADTAKRISRLTD